MTTALSRKGEAQGATQVPQTCNPLDVLHQIAARTMAYRRETGFQFHMTLDEDLPLVRVAERSLSDVLTLLIAMAVTSAERGHVGLSARLRLDDEDRHVVAIAVSDSGDTGPDSAQPPLFGQNGRPENLSACHQVLRRSGGDLLIDSVPGLGTSITVVLRAVLP